MSGNLWLWVSNRNGLQSKGKGRKEASQDVLMLPEEEVL